MASAILNEMSDRTAEQSIPLLVTVDVRQVGVKCHWVLMAGRLFDVLSELCHVVNVIICVHCRGDEKDGHRASKSGTRSSDVTFLHVVFTLGSHT